MLSKTLKNSKNVPDVKKTGTIKPNLSKSIRDSRPLIKNLNLDKSCQRSNSFVEESSSKIIKKNLNCSKDITKRKLDSVERSKSCVGRPSIAVNKENVRPLVQVQTQSLDENSGEYSHDFLLALFDIDFEGTETRKDNLCPNKSNKKQIEDNSKKLSNQLLELKNKIEQDKHYDEEINSLTLLSDQLDNFLSEQNISNLKILSKEINFKQIIKKIKSPSVNTLEQVENHMEEINNKLKSQALNEIQNTCKEIINEYSDKQKRIEQLNNEMKKLNNLITMREIEKSCRLNVQEE